MVEVDVIGKFFWVKGLLVIFHQVGKVRISCYFRKYPFLFSFLQVVLRPVVLMLRKDLFILCHPIITFIDSFSISSVFYLLWVWDCFIVKNVERNSLPIPYCCTHSAKYSCFIALSAVILYSGSYASKRNNISRRSLGQPLGRNRSIPIPFFGGKFISMWEAWERNRSRTSDLGVPKTLFILLTWSNSSFPGKRGFFVISSKRTQPKPQISIF